MVAARVSDGPMILMLKMVELELDWMNQNQIRIRPRARCVDAKWRSIRLAIGGVENWEGQSSCY